MKRLALFFGLLLLVGAGCTGMTYEDALAEAQSIAEPWIETSAPTYVYDGSNLQYDSAEQAGCDLCFDLIYTFDSNQAGYGDRSDALSAQVITPHEIRVRLLDGEVIEAVTDERYDEINERMLTNIELDEVREVAPLVQ